MKRVAPIVGVMTLGLMAALAFAAAPKDGPKPLLEVGKKYVFLCPSETKRTAEVVEDLTGGWYKMKYLHSDGVERMIWLNLNQVLYFQPEDPNHVVPPPAKDRSKLSRAETEDLGTSETR